MNKLAVIGDKESIILFKTLGFETVFATEAEEIKKAVSELSRQDFAIIFITEEAAQKIPDVLDYFQSKVFPALIPIPNKNGSLGVGMQGITKNVEKAVGTDILNN